MFRSFFSKNARQVSKTLSIPTTKPLGRWERPTSKQREDIKVLLANHDSCGDILCGNPVSLKNEIETILKKKP